VDSGPSPIQRSTSLTIERKVTGALNCAGYRGSPGVPGATVADGARIEVVDVSIGADSRAAIFADASMLIASNAVAAECDSGWTVIGVMAARSVAARLAAFEKCAPESVESDFADSGTCSTLSVSTIWMSPAVGSIASVPSRLGSRLSSSCSSTSGCVVPDLILPCAEMVLDAPACDRVVVSEDRCAPAGSSSAAVAAAPPDGEDPFRAPAVSSLAEVSNEVFVGEVDGVSDAVEAEESG